MDVAKLQCQLRRVDYDLFAAREELTLYRLAALFAAFYILFRY